MPLPPSHNNFYDNEDDESDYPTWFRKGRHGGSRHGGSPPYADSNETGLPEPRVRHRYENNPVVYPDTPTGRAMAERMNRNYHPDNPKYFVKGDTPAERDQKRSKRLSFGGE